MDKNNFTPSNNISNKEGIKKPIELPVTHNFTMFLIGVIVVGLVAFVSYTYLNITEPKQIISVEPSTQKDEFSDWKTYRNEEYEFEFKYPGGWGSVNDNISKTDAKLLLFSGGLSVLSTTSPLIHGIGSPPIGSMWVNIVPIETCDDPLLEKLNSDFILDSKPDTAEKSICSGPFRMYVGLWQADPNLEQNKKLLNQILSTFKFTNNYDTFDPDGTLSDISANAVFKNWINSKKVGYEQFESGNFSSQNIMKDSDAGIGKNYCNNADSSKKFNNSSGDMVTCFFSGEEPDSDLYLYGRTDNSSRRIGFCGTPCHYETGFWLDNGKFVFLWTLSDYEYENNMNPYRELHVDLFNLEENKIYSWKTKHLYK